MIWCLGQAIRAWRLFRSNEIICLFFGGSHWVHWLLRSLLSGHLQNWIVKMSNFILFSTKSIIQYFVSRSFWALFESCQWPYSGSPGFLFSPQIGRSEQWHLIATLHRWSFARIPTIFYHNLLKYHSRLNEDIIMIKKNIFFGYLF